MQTNGTNNVEVFDDLSQVTDEKLLKLRDVAGDHLQETFTEYMAARDRSIAIQLELQNRGIVKPKD
jgi:hypothetical protein